MASSCPRAITFVEQGADKHWQNSSDRTSPFRGKVAIQSVSPRPPALPLAPAVSLWFWAGSPGDIFLQHESLHTFMAVFSVGG